MLKWFRERRWLKEDLELTHYKLAATQWELRCERARQEADNERRIACELDGISSRPRRTIRLFASCPQHKARSIFSPNA